MMLNDADDDDWDGDDDDDARDDGDDDADEGCFAPCPLQGADNMVFLIFWLYTSQTAT